jgi:hypothetical protein
MSDQMKLEISKQTQLFVFQSKLIAHRYFCSDTLILTTLGEIFSVNEALCSTIVSTPNFLQNLRKLLCYGDTTLKQTVLWLLSNIICNSGQDCMAVSNSGAMFNIVQSARDTVTAVRTEALWCIVNMLSTLSSLNKAGTAQNQNLI